MQSDALRSLLNEHMSDWEVRETEVGMVVHGTLKKGYSGVEVTLRGGRELVKDALEALLRALKASGRIEEGASR